MEITTKLEFDAGHRIPHHKSSCKNLHSHRYAIEVTIKEWDHSFIVHKDDTAVLKFLESLDDHKTVVFPLVPTAENMALVAMEKLKISFDKKFGALIKPFKVRLYETPNNWADAY